MRDRTKATAFGVVAGFALGGLIGSATFGVWGGVVGSVVGVLAGGGTLAVLAAASLSTQDAKGTKDEESSEGGTPA